MLPFETTKGEYAGLSAEINAINSMASHAHEIPMPRAPYVRCD